MPPPHLWLHHGNFQEVGVVEHGEFLVGSLAGGGQVTLLPSLGGEQVLINLR